MADIDEQEDEYETHVREELSHVPLGELKAMQDKLGLKAFNKMKTGSQTKANTGATFKRLNKHRPAEFSARKPVPKQTVIVKQKITRDPRFDDLSGDFNPEMFNNSYGFLDKMKSKEKMELKKKMEETTNKKKKSQLKELYNRMEQREKAEKNKAAQRKMEKEWKQEERKKIEEGKKPYFLKKSHVKARLREQYEKELEESGKMQKYTQRKNKKLAAMEKKSQIWKTDGV